MLHHVVGLLVGVWILSWFSGVTLQGCIHLLPVAAVVILVGSSLRAMARMDRAE